MRLSFNGLLWALAGLVAGALLLALVQLQRANAAWEAKWVARDLSDQISLAQAIADARATEQHIHKQQQEALNHAHNELQSLRHRAADLHTTRDRLQSELDNAYTALASLGADPVAIRDGGATAATATLLAELHREVSAHAAALAVTADECYLRGRACEASYRALSCEPP